MITSMSFKGLKTSICSTIPLFMVMMLWPLLSVSQENQVKTADSLTTQPTFIPTYNIVQSIAEANEEIKQATQTLTPRGNLLRLDSLYVEYAELISERQNLARIFIQTNPSRREVENLTNTWRGYRSFLNSWQLSINNYLSRNAIIKEQLTDKEEIWDLTYQNAKEREVPTEVLGRVKSTWDAYAEIDQTIISYKNKFITLESNINDQIVIIEEVIESLVELRNSEIYNLTYLRYQPLWKKPVQVGDSLPVQVADSLVEKRSASELIKDNISSTREFIQRGENTFYLFLLLVMIFIISILGIRRSFNKFELPDEGKIRSSARRVIVKYPIWVVLLISLYSVRLFFENFPKLFDDTTLMLGLITSAILLRPHLQAKFKNLPWVIVAIVLIDQIKSYFGLSILQFRFYALLESVLILAGLIFFAHPYRRIKNILVNPLDTLILRLSVTFYFFISVSIISNVLGYTNLAAFMLKIVLQATDATLIFYTLLLVIDSIVIGVIHNRFNRNPLINQSSRISLETRALRITKIVVLLIWLYYFLVTIDLYQPLSEALFNFLEEPHKVGTITFTIGMIVTFVLILAASFTITSFISFLLDGTEVKLDIIKLPKGIPAAVSLVIRYFILAVGFVLAISSLGIELSKFNLLAGALGLGIGFGLQTVVSNFISGIILIFERPILPGDIVEVNNLLGKVNKIGVRSSRITTFDGSEVVVPNNNLISNDLINWTLSDNIRRLEIIVGTSYDADPNLVLKILAEVASEQGTVLKNPPPLALFIEFGESSINFRLLFWVYVQNILRSKSEVYLAIYNRFKELDIVIPYPQRVVHLPKDKDIKNR